MFDFSKICKTYEAMTPDELRQTLKKESEIVLPALAALNGSDGVSEFIVFAMTACAVDGRLDPEEYTLFSAVTGISLDYAAACELVTATANKESRHIVDIVADTFGLLSDDIKASMVSFCLCFCAANGKIGGKEKRFLKRLIK